MKKYDIHISAFKIANESIKAFEEFGFERDEFANNTRCEVTQYHGTYRGNANLPDNDLWESLCDILKNDESFNGGLEEESFEHDQTWYFEGKGVDDKPLLPRMYTEQPKAGVYKACDIHISIDLDKTPEDCLKHLEALEVASFDKPKGGSIHRIFTVTTDTLENGKKAFEIISKHLSEVKGIHGKMKLETTTRFYRQPDTAYTLPLTTPEAFADWLSKL